MGNKLFIIGCGAVGTSLGKALRKAGRDIIGIFDSEPEAASRAALILHTRAFGGALPEIIREADTVLVAVPDSAIEQVAALAQAEGLTNSDQVWIHCSGRLTSAAFAPIQADVKGCGSMHPAYVFPPKVLTEIPPEVFFAVEGDEKAVAMITTHVNLLKGNAVHVQADARTTYHAAMVMASNYIVTMLASAREILESIQVPEAQIAPLLVSLSQSAISRANKLGIGASLCGPIRRGDMSAVEDHIRALEKFPHEKELYIAAGKATVKLASNQPGYCPDTAVTLLRLLTRLSPKGECQ